MRANVHFQSESFMPLARFRTWIVASSVVSLAVFAACGGTTEVGGGTGKKDLIPFSVTAVSTDTIRGVVGGQGTLPLSVVVKNAAGEALDTTVVTFAVT